MASCLPFLQSQDAVAYDPMTGEMHLKDAKSKSNLRQRASSSSHSQHSAAISTLQRLRSSSHELLSSLKNLTTNFAININLKKSSRTFKINSDLSRYTMSSDVVANSSGNVNGSGSLNSSWNSLSLTSLPALTSSNPKRYVPSKLRKMDTVVEGGVPRPISTGSFNLGECDRRQKGSKIGSKAFKLKKYKTDASSYLTNREMFDIQCAKTEQRNLRIQKGLEYDNIKRKDSVEMMQKRNTRSDSDEIESLLGEMDFE